MALRKGGDLIAEFLVREKIPYVFGICGHGNVGLLDSLYHVNDRVKLVSPRHEQTAAHMADGFFRVSHRPAATLTSTGPGSANLIMALAVAQTDSSAIFSIRSEEHTSELQSLMRISYAVFCLKKKKKNIILKNNTLRHRIEEANLIYN